MKWLRNVFLVLANLFGLLVFFVSSLAVYDTITNKAGMGGNMHMYFNMSPKEYCLWNSLGILLSLPLVLFPIYFLNKGDERKLNKLVMHSINLILALIFLEIYLESRFVGKP